MNKKSAMAGYLNKKDNLDSFIPLGHTIRCHLTLGTNLPKLLFDTKVTHHDVPAGILNLACTNHDVYKKLMFLFDKTNIEAISNAKPTYSITGIEGVNVITIDWGGQDSHLAFMAPSDYEHGSDSDRSSLSSDHEVDNGQVQTKKSLRSIFPKDVYLAKLESLMLKESARNYYLRLMNP